MPKITEMIPADYPEWAQKAMDEGQFFRLAVEKVEALTLDLGLQKIALEDKTRLLASCEASLQCRDNSIEKLEAALKRLEDYKTHHHDWVDACTIAKEVEENSPDKTYWQHQLNTLKALWER